MDFVKRKPTRLYNYDYSNAGAYFITICTKNKKALLSKIVGFKSFTTTQYGKTLWQRSFYDHIIRNETDYYTHFEYIQNNPAKWAEDELYKEN